jgi:hypothetical protein
VYHSLIEYANDESVEMCNQTTGIIFLTNSVLVQLVRVLNHITFRFHAQLKMIVYYVRYCSMPLAGRAVAVRCPMLVAEMTAAGGQCPMLAVEMVIAGLVVILPAAVQSPIVADGLCPMADALVAAAPP